MADKTKNIEIRRASLTLTAHKSLAVQHHYELNFLHKAKVHITQYNLHRKDFTKSFLFLDFISLFLTVYTTFFFLSIRNNIIISIVMLYSPVVISIIEVLVFTIPVLLTVAFVTVAERKTMASMQRRLGPNIVGYYGLLQAFADALKLLLKEYISPTQANIILFFLGPVVTLIFSLLGYSVIPYGPGLAISDFNLGILYLLAVSSLSTYGILLAG
jgi:NADH-ubiquinone oxidoreductase chain 1